MTINTAKYRHDLPQLGKRVFITDGGLETVLVFQRNVDLPLFAAFDLLNSGEGIDMLKDYYLPYIQLALDNDTGIVLDTPTWRASVGWGRQLGYSPEQIRHFNKLGVAVLSELRVSHATESSPMVINGVIGPQDDGYNPSTMLDPTSAQAYHRHQVDAFADSAADMVTAVTMTYAAEAVGIARAAANSGIPAAISFTVETNGRLPDGTTLRDAINAVDDAAPVPPAYYMVNCAHPSHFAAVLDSDEPWRERIFGIRANASAKSHAELDEATELDDGNPIEFGELYRGLRESLPNLSVVGGCCGTDHRHVGEVCRQLF